jgi:6,7-dimethyl-8-ribityllumazine synthase
VSGDGAPALKVNGEGLRIAVVASLWHQTVMDGLVAGAVRSLRQAGAEGFLVRVPGAFELPLGVKRALGYAGPEASGAVALGVVVRGGTPHFEYVCQAATAGLTEVALATGKPVGFGLLTCDDEAQALARAGLPGSSEDKGAEAAQAVLAMLQTNWRGHPI